MTLTGFPRSRRHRTARLVLMALWLAVVAVMAVVEARTETQFFAYSLGTATILLGAANLLVTASDHHA
jgi:hypothetical protein